MKKAPDQSLSGLLGKIVISVSFKYLISWIHSANDLTIKHADDDASLPTVSGATLGFQVVFPNM